uniref:Peroxidase n=1 Tax=Cacopsylla melanoneura TaxID=428564 RepID=A0A8D8QJA5_9HEMI
MLWISLVCYLLPILLVNSEHHIIKRESANIPNTSPQDQLSQEVADKCFNPGPCDSKAKYRTIDGSCNNLQFPMWGMTNTAAIRLRPAVYSDGKKLPRKSKDGQELPNARILRDKLIKDKVLPDDTRYWNLVISWGQFISHDTAHSVPKGDGISCCSKDGKVLEAFSDVCMPILVPKTDAFYSKFGVECIDMVRTKTTDDIGCPLTPVQQVIDLTHFIDASPVYGSNKTIADSLRLFEKGQLRFQIGKKGGMYPPNHPQPREQCDIRDNEPEVCYVAGDLRVNQNSELTPIQIVLLRIHNKIASKLAVINPSWNDETLYQETRRIIIAIVQWITYKEFLPILIGSKIMKEAGIEVPDSGFETSYDVFTNPTTINEFETAAYRSLHSIVTPKVRVTSKTQKSADIELVDWMRRPSIVQSHLDQFLRGQQSQFILKQDKFEALSINNLLFHGKRPFGDDLEALSIQRQRDFGMPSYNEFRTYSNMPKVNSFDELSDVMSKEDIEDLKKGYAHVDDIDLYIGGLYERSTEGGGLFGPTFRNIVAEQFFRWKIGDRFFFTFENQSGSFTLDQLNELRKTGSGWLFCEGSDDIGSVHPNNMNNDISGNELRPCRSLPQPNFSKWKI